MKAAILLPILVVLVIAIIGLMAAAGINPFQKGATGGVVETAITELLDAKSFKVTGEVTAEIKAATEGLPTESTGGMLSGISSVTMSFNLSSMVDHTKKEALKTSSQVGLGVDAEGMQITGAVELLTIDSDVYVKLVSLPPMLLPLLGAAEDIKNQWIAIDLKALQEQYIQQGVQAGMEFDPEQIREQLEQITEEMRALFAGKTLFDIKQELGIEEINGITTKHYFVEANKQAIKEFVPEYFEVTKKYVAPEQKAEYEQALQQVMQDFSANFDKAWAAIGGIGFDIWVEKRGGRLVRVKWQKEIDPSLIEDMPEEIDGITIMSDFTFSNFNEKFKIEAPTQSKPLEEILSGIMSAFTPAGFLDTSSMPAVPSEPSGF